MYSPCVIKRGHDTFLWVADYVRRPNSELNTDVICDITEQYDPEEISVHIYTSGKLFGEKKLNKKIVIKLEEYLPRVVNHFNYLDNINITTSNSSSLYEKEVPNNVTFDHFTLSKRCKPINYKIKIMNVILSTKSEDIDIGYDIRVEQLSIFNINKDLIPDILSRFSHIGLLNIRMKGCVNWFDFPEFANVPIDAINIPASSHINLNPFLKNMFIRKITFNSVTNAAKDAITIECSELFNNETIIEISKPSRKYWAKPIDITLSDVYKILENNRYAFENRRFHSTKAIMPE